jgi:hypothetical protein
MILSQYADLIIRRGEPFSGGRAAFSLLVLPKLTTKTERAAVHCRTRSYGSVRLLMCRASRRDCRVPPERPQGGRPGVLAMTRPFEVMRAKQSRWLWGGINRRAVVAESPFIHR